jgi:hypothetical protein
MPIFSCNEISGKNYGLNFYKETPNFVSYLIMGLFPEICSNFWLEIFKYYQKESLILVDHAMPQSVPRRLNASNVEGVSVV